MDNPWWYGPVPDKLWAKPFLLALYGLHSNVEIVEYGTEAEERRLMKINKIDLLAHSLLVISFILTFIKRSRHESTIAGNNSKLHWTTSISSDPVRRSEMLPPSWMSFDDLFDLVFSPFLPHLFKALSPILELAERFLRASWIAPLSRPCTTNPVQAWRWSDLIWDEIN